MKSKIILPGGSGFMGGHLARHFAEQGYEVVILSRRPAAVSADNIRTLVWDGKTQDAWTAELEHACAVINLTGRSVDCRYNKENRDQILHSRLDATNVLAGAIAGCADPPKVWINAASATIYADTRGDQPANTEQDGVIGSGFSVDVCNAWEAAFYCAETPGVRKLCLRVSIVLGRDGGAMVPMLRLARLGLGGTMGPGDQDISWIHIDDVLRSIDFLLEREDLEGTFNIVSPDAHRNDAFMAKLRKQVGCPIGVPTPTPLLKLGARFIKTETELILKSRRVAPARLQDAGFNWTYPTLEAALAEICGQAERPAAVT